MKSKGQVLLLIMLLSASFLVSKTFAEGYEIKIRFKNLKNSHCYLGFNFGGSKYIRDTAKVDGGGLAVFKGNKPLEGGVYLIIIPSKNFFEFILTENRISMETDTLDFIKSMKVIESKENKAFFEYLQFMQVKYTERTYDRNELKKHKNNKDSTLLLNAALHLLDSTVKNYRESIQLKYPGYFFTKVIRALDEPKPRLRFPGENDTLYNKYLYEFYQNHFFDNVDFSDSRMLRTPLFESKINKYIDDLTIKNSDSLIHTCERVIEKSRANDTIFKYTLAKVFNKYIEGKYMGDDAVFVFIAEKYYLSGLAYWTDSNTLNKIYTEVLKKKSNLLGMKAPELTMKDTSGHFISMYDIKQPYTILAIWDPDCSHCRVIIPELAEWYKHHSRDSFQVYAVSTTTERNKWIAFIKNNKLDWINVWDPSNTSNYKMLYDAFTTPTIYIIDRKKTIQAKKIDVDKIDGMIRMLNKMSKP